MMKKGKQYNGNIIFNISSIYYCSFKIKELKEKHRINNDAVFFFINKEH